MALTAKQARFVAEYLIDLNATQAAIRAGYSARTAQEQSSRLLSNVMVAEAIAERQKIIAGKLGVTQEQIAEELAKIAFADIRKAINWRGHVVTEEETSDDGEVRIVRNIVTNTVTLVDSDEIDADTAAAIAQVSQNATGGVSLKMHDKLGALVDLAKLLGFYVEKNETKLSGDVVFRTIYEQRPTK